ncbi:hypothetical protein UlMin_014026 [Ulmus minor]
MKKPELVFVPLPGIGHLVSAVEFAKALLNHDERFSVTILRFNYPFQLTLDSNTLHSLSSSHAQIQFLEVPEPRHPPPLELLSKSREAFHSLYIESNKPEVKEVIVNHVSTRPVKLAGVVLDMFCSSMDDVAKELQVPSYVFFASGAGFLGFMLYLHTRHEKGGTVFENSDPDSDIASYTNSVPAKVLPNLAFSKEGGYISFVKHSQRFKKTNGIIVNTVLELESHAVGSLLDGVTPPVYTVGPVIDLEGKSQLRSSENQRDKIMTWLDNQPPRSVVFLCFGSYGTFSGPQLREIAIGLEKSGQRFLWSVRKTPSKNEYGVPSTEFENFGDSFPEGFLERTKELGLICAWAPQVEVLAHKAIGGFVSHCGWNSILESLWFGVPIVTWPLYAEQQLNAFQMVGDMGLALELRLDSRKDGGEIVMGGEIEKAVRSVVDGDCDIRRRVEEMSGICKRAVEDGGSSCESFRSLIDAMLANISLDDS